MQRYQEKPGVEIFVYCNTRNVLRGFQEEESEQFLVMNGNILLHFLTYSMTYLVCVSMLFCICLNYILSSLIWFGNLSYFCLFMVVY